jgi:hypothetical protein
MQNKATLTLDRTEATVILDALRFAKKDFEPAYVDMVSKKVKPGLIGLDGGELKTIYESLFIKGDFARLQGWEAHKEIFSLGLNVLKVRIAFHEKWEKKLLGVS